MTMAQCCQCCQCCLTSMPMQANANAANPDTNAAADAAALVMQDLVHNTTLLRTSTETVSGGLENSSYWFPVGDRFTVSTYSLISGSYIGLGGRACTFCLFTFCCHPVCVANMVCDAGTLSLWSLECHWHRTPNSSCYFLWQIWSAC